MNDRRLQVCHIAESDDIGGACKAAYKLHRALTELGMRSGMVVGQKLTDDDAVSKAVDTGLFASLRRKVRKRSRKNAFRPYRATRADSLELFSDGRGPGGRDLLAALPNAAVYALHWNTDLVDYLELFAWLGSTRPLLWRLSDQNAMTGGCHYALDCSRFEMACGFCPQLGSDREEDLTRRVFEYKRTALAQLDPSRVRIIAPSRWMQRSVERSALLSRFPCLHIATGVDLHQFMPRDKSDARRRLGLPENRPTIVFVSQSLNERRKGFDLLVSALAGLRSPSPPVLLSVGVGGDASAIEGLGMPHRPLGRLKGADALSDAYSAGDVFVMPSRADNLPNVILEAIACGTPVVGFDIGGVPDIVRDGVSGFIAPPGDVAAMREGVERILTDPELQRSLSASSRALAVNEFDSAMLARAYRDVIEDLAALNR